jgi:hypothetical protein
MITIGTITHLPTSYWRIEKNITPTKFIGINIERTYATISIENLILTTYHEGDVIYIHREFSNAYTVDIIENEIVFHVNSMFIEKVEMTCCVYIWFNDIENELYDPMEHVDEESEVDSCESNVLTEDDELEIDLYDPVIDEFGEVMYCNSLSQEQEVVPSPTVDVSVTPTESTRIVLSDQSKIDSIKFIIQLHSSRLHDLQNQYPDESLDYIEEEKQQLIQTIEELNQVILDNSVQCPDQSNLQ